MFKNILVPVDLTEKNLPAIDLAARLARLAEGRVHLLHVIELIPGTSLEEERVFYDRIKARVQKQLAHLGERIQALDARWHAEILYGSRAREILRRATELGADLIVASSHRVVANGRPGEGWGTLSYQVAVLAPCKVLLVK